MASGEKKKRLGQRRVKKIKDYDRITDKTRTLARDLIDISMLERGRYLKKRGPDSTPIKKRPKMPRTLQQPRSADGSGSELRDFDLTDYLGPKLTERAYDTVESLDRKAMKRFSRRVKDKRLKDRK